MCVHIKGLLYDGESECVFTSKGCCMTEFDAENGPFFFTSLDLMYKYLLSAFKKRIARYSGLGLSSA